MKYSIKSNANECKEIVETAQACLTRTKANTDDIYNDKYAMDQENVQIITEKQFYNIRCIIGNRNIETPNLKQDQLQTRQSVQGAPLRLGATIECPIVIEEEDIDLNMAVEDTSSTSVLDIAEGADIYELNTNVDGNAPKESINEEDDDDDECHGNDECVDSLLLKSSIYSHKTVQVVHDTCIAKKESKSNTASKKRKRREGNNKTSVKRTKITLYK
jgi:hypothetical protein